jgi:4-hydroxybenzoate polyprenyltransferase
MGKFLEKVENYLSLVRFGHTVFAMPFALIGFFLGVVESTFSFRLLILVLLCMVFARNAAMGFNRIVDLKYDSLNPRTKSREIPSGVISKQSASLFVFANAVLFIVTTAFINRLTLLLSPVALLVILGYSLSKRFTALCHFVVGLGLSLAPIGAYISVTGAFNILPLIYSFIVLTWVGGFDILYSLQDKDFDKNNNLRSIPSSIGIKNSIWVSILVHAITALLVVWAGIIGTSGLFYVIGAAIFISLLVFQHLIVKPNDLSRVNIAFGTTNGIASLLFAIFVILGLFV